MAHWLLGKRRSWLAFLLITLLVAGGLGWVTAAALRLENEQFEARAQAERDGRIRLALWRLESRLARALAREDSRPYNHYSALSAPALAIARDGQAMQPGTILVPSPLLDAELPDWMLLHFQADEAGGWASPQVLSTTLREHFTNPKMGVALTNVTPERKELLDLLAKQSPPADHLLAEARQKSEALAVKDVALLLNDSPDNGNSIPPSQPLRGQDIPQQAANSGYTGRLDQRNRVQRETQNPSQKDDLDAAYNNLSRNGETWLRPASPRHGKGVQTEVSVGALAPLWITSADGNDWLLLVRIVRIDSREICQGIVLDWRRIQDLLAAEVGDVLPEARLLPIREEFPANPEHAMIALPFSLEPGPIPLLASDPGWTPLHFGLVLAWAAALGALVAVGMGGRSLLELSERRIRFVSAVTHELRTPLTTLRLYLDMLTGGMVKDEAQKSEYLHTLNAETDRLNRLVANVLDFSRLENQRPQLHKSAISATEFLDGVHATWSGRCHDAGKDLVLKNELAPDALLETDVELARQILANLIDNACKYSRNAADNRIWLRARRERNQFLFEVEDHGPGVARQDRRSLFRPFRRGRDADVTAGGVGLGLALAYRWAGLLGGRLTLEDTGKSGGAAFRLELPLSRDC